MIDFKHLRGNIILSATAVGLSYIEKKVGVRPVFLPTDNIYQVSASFGYMLFITIFGKKIMDFMSNRNIVDFKGKDKNPNEGFIGPLKNETIGPKNWDFLPE